MWKETSEKLCTVLIDCCDQHIVRGIVMATFLSESRHACEISTYRYIIFVKAMAVCCFTFMISLESARHFADDAFGAIIRLGAGVALTGLTICAIFLKSSPLEDLRIWPAVCLGAHQDKFKNIELASLDDGLGICVGIAAFYISAGSLFHFYQLYDKRYGDGRDSREDPFYHDPGTNFLVYGVQASICLFGLSGTIYMLYPVTHLKFWLNGSRWLDRSKGNPESDPFALGQLLAAILFVLPAYSLFRALQGYFVFGESCTPPFCIPLIVMGLRRKLGCDLKIDKICKDCRAHCPPTAQPVEESSNASDAGADTSRSDSSPA